MDIFIVFFRACAVGEAVDAWSTRERFLLANSNRVLRGGLLMIVLVFPKPNSKLAAAKYTLVQNRTIRRAAHGALKMCGPIGCDLSEEKKDLEADKTWTDLK